MSEPYIVVSAKLPAKLVSRIDELAAQDLRTRTDEIAYLLRLGLTRLEQCDEMASSLVSAAEGSA